ncbi:LLM class flavin-dependent oxidoreductase [Candidatus Chloroploca asiatica]|uniref:Luciferase-like domain-containing protein n=1 Tax=Candidatus Chloroploca asiatica TaxID=1506545 RepID=A0A2H3KGC6_9CHLR|nr:LLM class flavin-dependent oxidoreductase [Candidatus Chloroploca asiatica]PDV96763.1 hypothetical protein A9Q02_05935 [Candidatus Chloroploca asiatica]
MLPLGFCLPTFGVRYVELRSAALAAESLGCDSLWVWDHYVSWNDPREAVLEGWTTLAGLAEATRSIRLGPLVANNTNRHPARLAKVAATLHELAAGRLELGLGAGGLAAEQIPFGIDQGDRASRTGRLEEALQIIPALWTGEPVDFAGQHYQLSGAIASPRLDTPPRIIVGGRSPALTRLAARYAGGLNLQWRFRDNFSQLLTILEATLADVGRSRADFDLSIYAYWHDLAEAPDATLETWANLGFNRAIVMMPLPLPIKALQRLLR